MEQQLNYAKSPVNIRFQLAGLWTSVMFCYIYGDYFELYIPGKVAGLIDGNNILNTPFKLLFAGIMLSIPALLIAGNLMLSGKICKWLNIVFGCFFTLLMLFIASQSFTQWQYFYVYLALVESLLTGVVVWKAIRWPKVEMV